jgi:hypothetical protein
MDESGYRRLASIEGLPLSYFEKTKLLSICSPLSFGYGTLLARESSVDAGFSGSFVACWDCVENGSVRQ